MIWASNNVTGTYASVPVAGGATPLTGSGLTANVVMKQFDTTNNKWLAGVGNGTGNLSGVSYTGSVNFRGAAAGNIVPSTSTTGTVNGVAGGIAKK